MIGYSAGGVKIVDSKIPYIVRDMMGDVVSLGGVGEFSSSDLTKVLAGKRASVTPSIRRGHEALSGRCSIKDLETMMQLLHLNMTALRYDEEAYAAWYKRTETSLINMVENPQFILSDSIQHTLYAGQPEMYPVRPEALKEADYKRSFDLARQRFDNAQDFTFYFIGNISPDALRPLVEQYIASLPKGRKAEKRPANDIYSKGARENRFELPMQTPKTTVYNVYSAPLKWTLKDEFTITFLYQIMNIVYTETIREQEGGTYGVQVYATLDPFSAQMSFLYMFDTNAEQSAHLEEVAYKNLQDMATNGPREVDFNKVRDYLAKKHAQDLKENSYWLTRMTNHDIYGIDEVTEWESILNSITLDDVKKMAQRVMSADRKQIVATGVAIEK